MVEQSKPRLHHWHDQVLGLLHIGVGSMGAPGAGAPLKIMAYKKK